MLIVGLGAGACGASSPTAPAAPAVLGAGTYSLIMFGTSTCLSGSGAGAGVSSAAIKVVLSSTAAFDVWRVSVPGHTLTGDVALVKGQLQGWLRGSAASDAVRLATGATPDAALAMESTKAHNGTYEGPVLVGTPRYEGVGSASGAYTTCSTNAFTLQPA
ncbi:MAG TPA: hypothetical protein VMN81_08230 [Vicinamibacterales bacterium]|nr:hypothetical protein [Vicinamibacterales bacterium]